MHGFDYSTPPHQMTGASGLEVRRPAQGVKPQASSLKLQATSYKLQVSREPHPERGWGLSFYFSHPHPKRGWGWIPPPAGVGKKLFRKTHFGHSVSEIP